MLLGFLGSDSGNINWLKCFDDLHVGKGDFSLSRKDGAAEACVFEQSFPHVNLTGFSLYFNGLENLFLLRLDLPVDVFLVDGYLHWDFEDA